MMLNASAQTYEMTFGGPLNERAISSITNRNGNTMIVSTTTSYGAGMTDILFTEFNPQGQRVFSTAFGGTGNDTPRYLEQTSDGGYIIAGFTTSFNASAIDIYVIKLTSTGQVQWSNRYGGSNDDYGTSIHEISTGYILTGYSYSWGAGECDAYAIMLDSRGGVIRANAYGYGSEEFATNCTVDASGGYLISGSEESLGAGLYDQWYLHIANDLSVDFSICAGSSDNEQIAASVQTTNRDFILSGHIRGFGRGLADMSVVRLTRLGVVSWSRAYGGTGNEAINGMTIDPNNDSCTFTGTTSSMGVGGTDVISFCTNTAGVLRWNNTNGGTGNDVGSAITRDVNGYKVFGGLTTGANREEGYMFTLDNNNPNSCHGTLTNGLYTPSIQNITSTITTTSITIPGVNASVTNTTTTPVTPITGNVTSTCSTLPVTLLSFAATLQNSQTVLLQWSTAMEQNNYYFVVQSSIDGIDFNDVEVVYGNGNSSSVINYETYDKHAHREISYYRLKQVDFDGKFSYSSVVPVNNTIEGISFNLYPTPCTANSPVTINIAGATPNEEVRVAIYDILSKNVYEYVFIADASGSVMNSLNLTTSLSPGTYIAEVYSYNQEPKREKLVVK